MSTIICISDIVRRDYDASDSTVELYCRPRMGRAYEPRGAIVRVSRNCVTAMLEPVADETDLERERLEVDMTVSRDLVIAARRMGGL